MTRSRQLSAANRDRLEELAVALRGWRGWKVHPATVVPVIREIGASGELLATPALLGFVFHSRREVAGAAAHAIRELVAEATPGDLVLLDGVCRQITWGYGLLSLGRFGGAVVQPSRLRRAKIPEDCRSEVLGVTSFSGDGYVREAAIRALERVGAGAVPYLLIRANDWVFEVRRAAKKVLMGLARSENADALVANMMLVQRLRTCARDDHEELIRLLENVAGSDEAREALERGILGPDRETGRACLAIAIAFGKTPLVRRALDARDVVIRVRAAKHLFEVLNAGEAAALADELLEDRWMRVRYEALRFVIDRGAGGLRERLEKGLMDLGHSVRRLAGYYARKHFDLDVAEFYRSRLTRGSDRQKSACILGLGDHGEAPDAHDLVRFLNHDSPRLQRSALGALASLDFEAHEGSFVEALLSELPGVSRWARDTFVRKYRVPPGTDLDEALLRSPHLHVRKNVLHVLSRCSKWRSIRAALMLVENDDALLAEHAGEILSEWTGSYNHVFSLPARGLVEEVSSRLEAVRDRLDPKLYETLRSCVAQRP